MREVRSHIPVRSEQRSCLHTDWVCGPSGKTSFVFTSSITAAVTLYTAAPIFPKEWMPDTTEPFKKCFQQALCVTGIFVAAIDPKTLAVEEIAMNEDGFKGRHGLTSTALPVGNDLWLTSERSGCLAIFPYQSR
jgi:hypothetical protein